MSVQRINYLALSQDKRQKGIVKLQQALRDALANPILTEQQRVDLRSRLHETRLWVTGDLETEIHEDEEVPEEVLKARQAKADAENERAAGLEEKLKAEKERAEKAKKDEEEKARKGKSHEVNVDEDVPVEDGVG